MQSQYRKTVKLSLILFFVSQLKAKQIKSP